VWKLRYEIACNRAEALKLLSRREPAYDLVTLDTNAAEAVSLAGLIRSEKSAATAPIILLVPKYQRCNPQGLGELNVIVCPGKPIRHHHLLDTLEHAWDKSPPGETDIIYRKAARAKIKKARVLLAEDNLVNQKVAITQLKRLGYEADVVSNGVEALEALNKKKYDVILMDCQMPEMDGFEATRRIRGMSESLGHVRIVAMTANAMQGDRERCLKEGMDAYIAKPVALDELRTILEKTEHDL